MKFWQKVLIRSIITNRKKQRITFTTAYRFLKKDNLSSKEDVKKFLNNKKFFTKLKIDKKHVVFRLKRSVKEPKFIEKPLKFPEPHIPKLPEPEPSTPDCRHLIQPPFGTQHIIFGHAVSHRKIKEVAEWAKGRKHLTDEDINTKEFFPMVVYPNAMFATGVIDRVQEILIAQGYDAHRKNSLTLSIRR